MAIGIWTHRSNSSEQAEISRVKNVAKAKTSTDQVTGLCHTTAE